MIHTTLVTLFLVCAFGAVAIEELQRYIRRTSWTDLLCELGLLVVGPIGLASYWLASVALKA